VEHKTTSNNNNQIVNNGRLMIVKTVNNNNQNGWQMTVKKVNDWEHYQNEWEPTVKNANIAIAVNTDSSIDYFCINQSSDG